MSVPPDRGTRSRRRSAGATGVRAVDPRAVDLLKDVVKTPGHRPLGVVPADLRQIRDITDVVALAVLLHVLPLHLAPRDGLGQRERLQDRAGVAAAAAEVVDLAGSWFV